MAFAACGSSGKYPINIGDGYQDVYDYFTGYVTEGVKRFPNLSLTVTSGRYVTFSDPVI